MRPPSFSASPLPQILLLLGIISLMSCSAEEPIAERASYKEKIITFNRPSILLVGDSIEVLAVLDANKLNEREKNDLFHELQGEPLEKSIHVHQYLSASLKADPDMISITPKDEKLRQPDEHGRIFWSWYIRPLRIGRIEISLDIFSQDSPLPGSPVSEALVLHETWTAEARGFELIKYYVSQFQPVYAGLAAFATGVAAIIGFFFSKKSEKSKDG